MGLASFAVAQPPDRGDLGADVAAAGRPYGTAPGGPNGQMGPPPNAMFNAIDADGDGAITMRELRKAVVALKQFDTDKDGKITLAEVVAQSGSATEAGGQFGFRGQGFGGDNNVGDPRPGGPNMMQFDRNGDGQLSPEEVPTQMRGMLRGTDQNGDGKLDAQELQAIQQRMNERVRGQRSLPPGVSVGPQGVSGTPQKP
jgi:hypothetical protein